MHQPVPAGTAPSDPLVRGGSSHQPSTIVTGHMKILIASTPATGHLNPLLAIGRFLIAEGHEIAFYRAACCAAALKISAQNSIRSPQARTSICA
jgi:hypothetical protein